MKTIMDAKICIPQNYLFLKFTNFVRKFFEQFYFMTIEFFTEN